MDWITDYIAIGNYLDARQVTKEKVDAILCLKPNCCSEKSSIFEIASIPLKDGAGNDPRDIEEAVAFIDAIVSEKERILVHCHAGRSRSVGIVARYFMQVCGMSKEEALSLIKSKREIWLAKGIEAMLR